MGRKKTNLIEKFIKLNGLDFSGSGSTLNGNCVILAGYACYLDLSFLVLSDLIAESKSYSPDFWVELEKVFDYAEKANYGAWWKTPEAIATYKF